MIPFTVILLQEYDDPPKVFIWQNRSQCLELAIIHAKLQLALDSGIHRNFHLIAAFKGHPDVFTQSQRYHDPFLQSMWYPVDNREIVQNLLM